MQDRLFRKVALERASSPERLDSLMQVTQPNGWLMLAIIGLFLVALGVWSITARIRTTVEGQGQLIQQGDSLQAVVYLDADAVQNVTPGITAFIAPVSISAQQYGYLQGQVISVSTVPNAPDNPALTPSRVTLQATRSSSRDTWRP